MPRTLTPLASPAFTESDHEPRGRTSIWRNIKHSNGFRRLFAGGRCLVIATVACLITGPLFRKSETPAAAHPVSNAAAVNVTDDVARRLAPTATAPGTTADGTLWAGLQ